VAMLVLDLHKTDIFLGRRSQITTGRCAPESVRAFDHLSNRLDRQWPRPSIIAIVVVPSFLINLPL
jgi:hypothetical protein